MRQRDHGALPPAEIGFAPVRNVEVAVVRGHACPLLPTQTDRPFWGTM